MEDDLQAMDLRVLHRCAINSLSARTDLNDASVMRIPFGYKCEQESRVEERHALG